MAVANQFIQLTGQLFIWIDNLPVITASRVSVKLSKPINKQKSATAVGIATGIPDPSGNIKLMPQAGQDQFSSIGLVLDDNPHTIVIGKGTERYQITGAFFNDASLDNDPGAASLDNTVGFEAAIIKKTA